MFDANESGLDRVVRITAGLALLALGWSGAVAGGAGLAFKIIGFVPLLTGLFGWCPLYTLVRFTTEGGMHRTRTT
ncbi:MAG: DUF2892 domain-containing protein [Gemmatimonadaceae bacterium]|nr:DUF2892 domain-containing protein [Gemmatimonadaceae bacterium]